MSSAATPASPTFITENTASAEPEPLGRPAVAVGSAATAAKAGRLTPTRHRSLRTPTFGDGTGGGASGLRGAVPASGQKRNCFTISTAPRDMSYGGGSKATDTPPSTKYRTVPLDVSSRHERLKGGTIRPLPKPHKKPPGGGHAEFAPLSPTYDGGPGSRGVSPHRRSRRRATPTIAGDDAAREGSLLWKRPEIAPDDEEGLVRALRSMQVDETWTTRCKTSAWTHTPIDRSDGVRKQLGTAAATPPPGRYKTPAPEMGGPATRGGRISKAARFPDESLSRRTPGPGAYSTSTAPMRANSRGPDFSRAPGGRCLGGGSYFVTKRSASAVDSREIGGGGDLTALLAPGPGAYDGAADARAAFRQTSANELSPVAASFLAQRIPFDRSQMSPAVISDIVHVRTVAEDIARHRLRA